MKGHIPIHAVLLAAGASTRFGPDDKLLADVGGEPLVARSARRLQAQGLDGITAVVADTPGGRTISGILRELGLSIVVNPDASRGMGTSIACGTASVDDPAAGIMIVPSDMPLLDNAIIQALMEAYRDAGGQKIVHAVTAAGEQRNPVIWPPALRPALVALSGSAGGKQLLQVHKADTITRTATPRVFEDIDTQDDLLRFRSETL